MSTVEEIQSAPEDLFLLPHGVLHKAFNYCLMEYSIWHYSGAVWSALELALKDFLMLYEVLHMTSFQGHMEYSMWLIFDAIWSASYYFHQCLFWKKYKELHETCL